MKYKSQPYEKFLFRKSDHRLRKSLNYPYKPNFGMYSNRDLDQFKIIGNKVKRLEESSDSRDTDAMSYTEKIENHV